MLLLVQLLVMTVPEPWALEPCTQSLAACWARRATIARSEPLRGSLSPEGEEEGELVRVLWGRLVMPRLDANAAGHC